MRFKNLICSLAIAALLAAAAFAAASPPLANMPAFERSSAAVAVNIVITDSDNSFVTVHRTVTVTEVGVSLPDIATTRVQPTAGRTATASGTYLSRVQTNASPPIAHNGKLVDQPIDTENEYVPLGSPKPVEATARNGS